ncbi:MAG: hypothetical protein KME59_23155 [Trichormus sp. ATA11-4-KO1]|nr:hypothetical protein [Trichormus sp. ATA11-4-KO1]
MFGSSSHWLGAFNVWLRQSFVSALWSTTTLFRVNQKAIASPEKVCDRLYST